MAKKKNKKIFRKTQKNKSDFEQIKDAYNTTPARGNEDIIKLIRDYSSI